MRIADIPKSTLLFRTAPSLAVFVASFTVYLLTLEPSVSWWDCGEFIAAAAGLEVGHPPGAPLFLLIARIFSLLAPEPAQIALMVNILSALCSALTVLFLYWTIKMLAEKGHRGIGAWGHREESQSVSPQALKPLSPILAGVVGSLTYAFTDTFWFSAVEGEVYAMSSLFTAVVFWAILRWEREMDQPGSFRWILLIAYLMGLSIGVHLLNLLAIPAIVLIVYFRKYPQPTAQGILKAVGLSLLLLGLMMYGLIPGVITLAAWFELFFINIIGLPYSSGLIIFIILLVGTLIISIRETRRQGKVWWNHALLALSVILIGYSSYTIILIRAAADPPMNQNRPDNAFSLLSYLNREQYGDRPLLHGHWYNAPRVGQKPGKPVYAREDGKYKIVDRSWKPLYDKRFNTLFPRMWQGSPEHVRVYQEWARIRGIPVQITGPDGKPRTENKPTFVENLRFFFSYQVGHMYFRYFMWNFAGRQNDTESQGGIRDGNWISGIGPLDRWRLGPQEHLPDRARRHPSRNVYFLLPLILGFIGAWNHFRKNQKDFWVVFTLFVFTGIAIVIYLNQTPNQPRERDYSYAASFYAFAIWIGLGTLRGRAIRYLALLIPVWMLIQNYDDHDRSGRYLARDFAHNYLNSCAPNAILFTNGDNDTFPLWYAQEVEGVRRDVRVICLPYLATDWYIDQMKKRAWESEPVPFTLSRAQYGPGKRDYIYVYEQIKDTVDIRDIINFIGSNDPKTKLPLDDGTLLDYLPARRLRLPVDRDQVIKTGTVSAAEAHRIEPAISWEIRRGSLYKNDLMILDLIAHNNWERPIYFTSLAHENILGLQQWFRLEGFAYRFVPIRNENTSGYDDAFDSELLYDRLMNRFTWGNMEKPGVHIDYNTYRTTRVLRLRQRFAALASQLLDEGRRDSALAVAERVGQILPAEKFAPDLSSPAVAEVYYRAGQSGPADKIVLEYVEEIRQDLAYIVSLEKRFGSILEEEGERNVAILSELLRLGEEYQSQPVIDKINSVIEELRKESK